MKATAKKTNENVGRAAESARNVKPPNVPGSSSLSSVSASGSSVRFASNSTPTLSFNASTFGANSSPLSMPPSGLFSSESSGNVTSFGSLSSFAESSISETEQEDTSTGSSPGRTLGQGYRSREQSQSQSSQQVQVSQTTTGSTLADITVLSDSLLQHIFAIATARSYASRQYLPLVCRRFRSLTIKCPKMWDTFEVMTGNQGALNSRHQIDYVVRRSESEPLSIGVGIASSRMGAWKTNANDEGAADGGGGNEVLSAPTSSRRAVNMIGCLQSLMPRVEELIVDVYDDELDREVERSLLLLFRETSSQHLKRLTLLGSLPIDRIYRQWRSLGSLSLGNAPSFPSLQHLSLGYSVLSPISHPMPEIISLRLSFMEVKPTAPGTVGYFPIHVLLLNFPGLLELEIVGNISKGDISHSSTRLVATSESRMEQSPSALQPPSLTMSQLQKLTLNGLELTSPLLSSLRIPNAHTLVLKDFELGFDPREVQFETKVAFPDPSLYSATTPTKSQSQPFNVSKPPPPAYALRPLPFGTFLVENAYWWSLRHLTLERLPEMVVRMCTDFVRVVGGVPLVVDGGSSFVGTGRDRAEQVEGLTDLRLIEFRWPDWANIFPSTSFHQSLPEPHTPKMGEHSQSQKKDSPTQPDRVHLPYLRRLTVKLDHIPNQSSRHGGSGSGGSSGHGNKYAQEIEKEREEWMKGLLLFAEQRISRRAVIKMLREWKMEVPGWILDKQPGNSQSHNAGTSLAEPGRDGKAIKTLVEKVSADIARTLDEVSLVTGYTDNFAFVYSAWLAMQRQGE